MVERILRPHGLADRGRLLDVGCGTGKSFQPWERRGWSILACDASPAMLRRAAAKAGPRTETLVADARDLDVLGSFDLVTLVDDVVNYLEPGELVATFAGAARNLAPRGLLAFDVNTLISYRTFFAETEVHEDGRVPRDLARAGRGRVRARRRRRGDARRLRPRRRTGAGRGRRRSTASTTIRSSAWRGRWRRPACASLGAYGVDDDCRVEQPVDEERQSKAVLVARRAAR